MLDPIIANFLADRKAIWLKEKLKVCKTDEESQKVETKATEKFCLENWLPDAAKRSGDLSISTHPCTFTHPSSRKHPDKNKKTTGVVAKSVKKLDGFLRSGNAETELDVFGNAAVLDVHKFLSLKLSDGKTVLEHLEESTESIQKQFCLASESYENIKIGLLEMKQTDSKIYITSERVKQVYFPVGDDYHLLSILTASGLMFKLKEQINIIRFSDQAKQAREDRRNNKPNEQGFDELYNLTEIGFGGANKQNISNLNSKYLGTAYLLQSLPPQLKIRTLRRPNNSFFVESLYFKDYQESFNSFHKLLAANYNNIDIRVGRDKIIIFVIEQVMEKVWQFRQLAANWTENSLLPLAQKIWLDDFYIEQREAETAWLDEIINHLIAWFRIAYEKIVGKEQAIFLGDVELRHIEKVLTEMAEDLR